MFVTFVAVQVQYTLSSHLTRMGAIEALLIVRVMGIVLAVSVT
jgi:hypothetical protein